MGQGPVFPVAGADSGPIRLAADSQEDGYYPIKTLWVAPPGFMGDVLVRGLTVPDGTPLRFSAGFAEQADVLQINWPRSKEAEWREWASFTWVPGSGCFQWQVDTADATLTVVFEATLD